MNTEPLALTTSRMVIRHFHDTDAPALARILGDPRVMHYSVRGVLDERAVGEFVRNCIDCYRSDGFGPMAVIDSHSQALIGFCGLNAEQVDGAREVEIGYRLEPGFWGRGLATEAVDAVLAHGFGTLSIDSIIAIVQPENVASVKVLHKTGFHHYIHSQYHRLGVRIYRMSGAQWRERHC